MAVVIVDRCRDLLMCISFYVFLFMINTKYVAASEKFIEEQGTNSKSFFLKLQSLRNSRREIFRVYRA